MSDSSFISVFEKKIERPLGEWPREAHYEEIGAWPFENLNAACTGCEKRL